MRGIALAPQVMIAEHVPMVGGEEGDFGHPEAVEKDAMAGVGLGFGMGG